MSTVRRVMVISAVTFAFGMVGFKVQDWFIQRHRVRALNAACGVRARVCMY
jgi:hypothetical protein